MAEYTGAGALHRSDTEGRFHIIYQPIQIIEMPLLIERYNQMGVIQYQLLVQYTYH